MTQNSLDLELRHVKPSQLAQLSAIIDKSKAWKELLEKLSEPLGLKVEYIQLIEQQYYCGKSPTLALLNHWSITGRRRPTVKTLVNCLKDCNLIWAEDYVKREILNYSDTNPAQQLGMDFESKTRQRDQIESSQNQVENLIEFSKDVSGSCFIIDDEFKFEDLSDVMGKLCEHCPRYSFESIYESTNRFCHRPFDSMSKLSGRCIGKGRFSSVFLAKTHVLIDQQTEQQVIEKQTVAAKLLKAECNLGYLTNEINLARRIKHESILELLGISVGHCGDSERPAYICLVYTFMPNGSLLECLKLGLRCNDHRHLNWLQRVDIATRVARGISYLHTFTDGTIIHRDIKTANILLDSSLKPKLGDFTLVRQLDPMRHNATQYSQNIIGTSVYMPPEAFRGDISTKFDIFSFGIVMFELLTGLKPFDEDIGEDLLTYISEKLSDIDDKLSEETVSSRELLYNGLSKTDYMTESKEKFLAEILDKKAGDWNFTVAKTLFNLALRATEVRKRDRPEIMDILTELEKLAVKN